ncbi:MAG: hypothetical protein ONB30_12345 [candidate division KSB1 bacterium]|nr:hypothetical protein [candidate division KSB1 bacterium]
MRRRAVGAVLCLLFLAGLSLLLQVEVHAAKSSVCWVCRDFWWDQYGYWGKLCYMESLGETSCTQQSWRTCNMSGISCNIN